ncbi:MULTISPECIES: ZapG family protein [Shewanella]|uniref:Z-ring associated protein G n=1 Tax=Shewanella indica TaxID=768528 RepID=A0ABU4QDP0_9GAMM|nr:MULTISPECIES: DUF1043 family protein [Shewanella]BCV38062.1 hypothetical protein TUM17377_33900 [Shewanella chilikensis]MCE9790947.1 YhcB family protein [Shewanella indica]MDX6015461.1 DUF1043 family protein [Shewanella indica]NDO75218.1 DUF1043 family protein [Shewanella sp. SE1]TVP13006.1 hypothetical protein AYI96_04070 [Shewanella sp. MSW]
MEWPLVFAAFILGLILGYIGKTLVSRGLSKSSKSVAIERSKMELSQHKQEVSDHLAEQRALLGQLTEQINRLNQHWNQGSQRLAKEEQLAPLPFMQTSISDLDDKSDAVLSPESIKN